MEQAGGGGGFVRQILSSDYGKGLGHQGPSHPGIPGVSLTGSSQTTDLKGLS